MALSIRFDLSNEDLEHFRTLMRQSRENTQNRTQAEVIQAAIRTRLAGHLAKVTPLPDRKRVAAGVRK